jgi:c-di-GMP-binding flagellar brake protein YcgR
MTDSQQYNNNENDDDERRNSFRLDMEKELVDIFWHTESGDNISQRIVCLDFSKGGLKLACEQAIPLDTEVKVCFKAADKNSQMLFGQVIRQVQQPDGFFDIALRLNGQ